jgi:hypothetical protein
MSEVGRPSTSVVNTQSPTDYPDPDHTWECKQPEAVGIASNLLQEVITFANHSAHAGYPPDFGTHLPHIHGGRRYDDGVILVNRAPTVKLPLPIQHSGLCDTE